MKDEPFFLIDESLSPKLTLKLRGLRYKAKAVREIELRGAEDEEIIKWALKNAAIIITSDLDFGELWYWRYYGALGIIVLRLPSQKLEAQEAVIEYLHKEGVLKNPNLKKSLVISTQAKYRIRM